VVVWRCRIDDSVVSLYSMASLQDGECDLATKVKTCIAVFGRMCAYLRLYYRVGSSTGMLDRKRVGSSTGSSMYDWKTNEWTSHIVGCVLLTRARGASAGVEGSAMVVALLFATKL
jgi:hypothetical protein